jgi:hypothetical protein
MTISANYIRARRAGRQFHRLRPEGWEATRRLKGNSQTRDIPVIAAARIT